MRCKIKLGIKVAKTHVQAFTQLANDYLKFQCGKKKGKGNVLLTVKLETWSYG